MLMLSGRLRIQPALYAVAGVVSSISDVRLHGQQKWLSSQSMVEKGDIFEEEIANVLNKLNMTVHNCGGPNDRGIDLQGVWDLKSERIPVCIQCKDTNYSTTAMIREFSGVMGRVYKELGIIDPQNPEGKVPPIGFFATSKAIRNSMLREAALCALPLVLLRVQNGKILSLQPNYSLLKIHPSIQFMFDVIQQTSVPVIVYKGERIIDNTLL